MKIGVAKIKDQTAMQQQFNLGHGGHRARLLLDDLSSSLILHLFLYNLCSKRPK